jgi:hypothetical protein
MKPVVLALALLATLGQGVLGGPGGARATPPIRLDVQLGGGSVVAWDASDETGNSLGGVVLMGLGDFSFGVGGAAVMPDSRLQGEFGAFWVEGRWYFLGRDPLFQPYAVAGAGFASADGFEPGPTGFIPARWSTALGPIVMLGAGARYGEATGLFLAADLRAWNHTHLGIQLLAGFAFF